MNRDDSPFKNASTTSPFSSRIGTPVMPGLVTDHRDLCLVPWLYFPTLGECQRRDEPRRLTFQECVGALAVLITHRDPGEAVCVWKLARPQRRITRRRDGR